MPKTMRTRWKCPQLAGDTLEHLRNCRRVQNTVGNTTYAAGTYWKTPQQRLETTKTTVKWLDFAGKQYRE
jgi:hypothetical protein